MRNLITVAVLLCIILTTQAFCQDLEKVALIPWGSDDSSLGLINLPEVELVGPTSFSLDKDGNIIICDVVNECIKKFDSKGKFVEVVAKDVFANHVAVDSKGDVFARLDKGAIDIYSNKKKVKNINIKSKVFLIEGYEQGISISSNDDSDWLAVNDPKQNFYKVSELDGNIQNAKVTDNVKKYFGKPEKDNIVYRPKWVKPHYGFLERYTYDGEKLEPIEITTNDRLGSIVFKGKDDDGNLYVETERIKDRYAHLEMRVYTPSGELLKTIEFPNDYYTTIYRKTWVKPSGEIIQMQTLPEGVLLSKNCKL